MKLNGPPMVDTETTSTKDLQSIDSDWVSGQLLSNDVTLAFQWLFFSVLSLGISLFGISANIINIICFVRQGFTEPINISLLGLAISDLGCLITLLWSNICFTPAVAAAELPFEPIELQYLISGMPHTCFNRVTSWMTALITLERCLSITVPLKVKNIVTQRRVAVIVICVFIIFIFSGTPAYVVNSLELKFFPERNKTILGLVYKEDRDNVEKVSYAINNVFIPFSAFVFIVVCTIILVVKLRTSEKWRMMSANAKVSGSLSHRNRKVAKMVVMISTLFIGCFIPVAIIFIVMSFEPRFSIIGEYRNILTVTGGISGVLATINSSGNIFVYYHMSSKFKDVFTHLMCGKQT